MPPTLLALAPAAIGAVGTLGGAALQSRAQNKATDAASKSTAEALAFNKEQKAAADADYARRLQQYDATRQALYKHLGIDIAPPSPMGGSAPMSPGQPTNGADMAVPRGGSDIPPPTIGGPGVGARPQSGGMTIGDMIKGWNPSSGILGGLASSASDGKWNPTGGLLGGLASKLF